MGSTAVKAGMSQSKGHQGMVDRQLETRNKLVNKVGTQKGAFGKSKSRKRRGQSMLDRQLATIDDMKGRMRQPGDVSGVQDALAQSEAKRQAEGQQRFALRGMKGSALAKIVEDNKAKTKKHLK